MTGPLSDAHRRLVLGAAVAALAALMLGSSVYLQVVPQGWDAVQADTTAWDGQELVLSLYTVEAIEGPDRYVLRHGNWAIPVVGPVDALRVGGDVTVRGTFRAADGVVVERWRELAPLRQGKRILGIGSIVVLAALWPSLFTRRGRLLVSRA